MIVHLFKKKKISLLFIISGGSYRCQLVGWLVDCGKIFDCSMIELVLASWLFLEMFRVENWRFACTGGGGGGGGSGGLCCWEE